MDIPERKKTYTELKKHLGQKYAKIAEKQIYKYVYYKAVEQAVPLDWNNKLFSELYFIYSYKFIYNAANDKYVLELLKKGQDITEKKDIELSTVHHDKLVQKNYVERSEKYLKDTECHKCKRYLLKVKKIQSRSLDEGASFLYICSGCNYSWQEN